jgi:hypothetical protein
MGWSLPYRIGVLGRWKMAAVYPLSRGTAG